MPTDDVSDLRDVVDAINKLCDTMKSSYDGDDDVVLREVDEGLVEPTEIVVRKVEIHVAERWCDPTPEEDESGSYYSDPITVEPSYDSEPTTMVYDLEPATMEPVTYDSEPTAMPPVAYDSESTTTLPVANDSKPPAVAPVTYEPEVVPVEPVVFETEPVPCEPTSEMYYTASSEVSLVSDTDFQERAQSEDSDRESGRDDRNSVMAGHVAAMRERFESMTRTNTPCPDLIRSTSPSFEVFRNLSTSPDIEKS